MSVERSTYLDSSAIVKLAIQEAESAALRRLLRRRSLVSSALARTEVTRAILPLGGAAVQRSEKVLKEIDLVRINDRVLSLAGTILPLDLRSLDAIHLATALLLGSDLRQLVTYDARLAAAATAQGLTVIAPKDP